MCGIAGFVGDFGEDDRRQAATRMTQTLEHRGPDGSGHWLDNRAALGHRRLSIIDLTTAGAQPMIGPSGAVISFNGEIYNYRELRAELEASGERFTSDSDTEVLLRLFEREGERCLDRLVGMFAFAVWDPQRGRLFLARDRLGKKPLYYSHDGQRFAFASEIKALLELREVSAKAEIDPLAISDFLSLGYILSPKSALCNIRRLPAAHFAWFDTESGRLSQSEYWKLEEHFLDARLDYNAQARERFADLLSDAVSIRLRSDVPVGVFLSGGIDSASVAAAVAALKPEGVRAFCVGFKEASFDESAYAEQVARHIGIPFTRLENSPVEPDLLRQLVQFIDEPFADTSMMPTWQLNQSARQHVTVALTGDGADEILAGYPTYRADEYYRLTRHIPHIFMRGLSNIAEHMLKPSYRKVGWDYKIRQFLKGHGQSRERAHYGWRMIFSEEEKRQIMGDDLLKACAGYDPFDSFDGYFKKVKGASFLDQALFVDIKTWLQDDILVKADRMSMASSLEVRSPFLDHRLVELAARLPLSAKMDASRQKVILKEVMANNLPASIIGRKKAGFGAPTRSIGCTKLDAGSLNEMFREEFHLFPEREDVTYKSFSLAVLSAWLKIFAENRSGRA